MDEETKRETLDKISDDFIKVKTLTEEEKEQMINNKEVLTTEPIVLHHPDFEKDFEIQCDARIDLGQHYKVYKYGNNSVCLAVYDQQAPETLIQRFMSSEEIADTTVGCKKCISNTNDVGFHKFDVEEGERSLLMLYLWTTRRRSKEMTTYRQYDRSLNEYRQGAIEEANLATRRKRP